MPTPWLDKPVMLHSSRSDMCKLNAEQCAYRRGHWRYWYEADHVYALGTVYFFVGIIAFCTIGFWALRLAPSGFRSRQIWQKPLSSFRFLTYRRYDLKALGWHSSPGILLLLLSGALFFLAMTLGPQPYYWPNTKTLSYGNSPPLATRTGWMSLACLPFMIILATKANMIASFTGVSHERLIAFHNWVGWAMFVLALIHTFPFIIFHIWKGDMVAVWNKSVVYWTGVVALLAQAYLQVGSLSWVRARYYEFFKVTHFIAALTFVIFFFLHCDFRLSSWDYFIATGVLYTLSFLYSQIRTYFEFGIFNHATFTPVSNLALRISIPVDTMWRPGQHFFLRFITLGVHSLSAHPFTICSVPAARATDGKSKSKLVFYVHSKGGLTGRLAKAAVAQPGYRAPVLLDGPYGGVRGNPLASYDQNLIIACGSGAALSLGFVMEFALRGGSVPSPQIGEKIRSMHVIIATRDPLLSQWYEEVLLDFMEDNGIAALSDNLRIDVYVTGPNRSTEHSSSDMERKGGISSESTRVAGFLAKFTGRPNITAVVKETTLQPGISVGIVACGPSGVLEETQNEAAAAQLRILKSAPGAREVYLHTELFSW